jgi:hypothetical protein
MSEENSLGKTNRKVSNKVKHINELIYELAEVHPDKLHALSKRIRQLIDDVDQLKEVKG